MKVKMKWVGKSVVLLVMLVFVFVGCNKKVTFQNSAIVPSAEGTVKIKQDNNKNYDIHLEVDRLADPSRLTPPQNVYVVWMETSNSGPQNIGQLRTSTKGMSKSLSSSLKTVSSHKPTGFFITAEDDGDGNYPGDVVVLQTGRITYK